MSETIDELLVGLGLNTDKQSFQEGMSMFNGLRGAAMSFIGVIGAGVGASALSGFASDLDVAGRNAERLGVSVGYITQVGDAMAMAGGNSSAAVAEIENMARLLDEFRYNTGGDAFSLAAAAGLDPAGIADAENAMQAYRLLIDRAENMDDQQRRVALRSLGFGQETNFLAQAGGDQMREWMQTSQNLADRTDEMVEQAREFNQELNQLGIGIRGLTDAIMLDMMPELTSFVEAINNWLGEEGVIDNAAELINDGPEALGRLGGDHARGWLSDQWDSWVDWFVGRDTPMTRSGNTPMISPAALEGIRMMQAGGLRPGEMSYEPSSSELIPQSSFTPTPTELNSSTLEAIRSRQERGETTPQDRAYLQQQMRQAFPEKYQGNVTINVNGAQNPEETARAVRREIVILSERTINDFRNPVV